MIKGVGKSLIERLGRLKRGVYLERQRQSNEDGLQLIDLPRPEYVEMQATNGQLIGVGVCQGEAIVIHSSGTRISYLCQVSEKLQYSDVAHIDKELVKNLYCLAHRLEYEIQSSQSRQDSQMQETVKLDDCFCDDQDILPLSKPFLTDDGNGTTQATRGQEKDKQQKYLKLMKCNSCPYSNRKLVVNES